jgi:hypothetical protein
MIFNYFYTNIYIANNFNDYLKACEIILKFNEEDNNPIIKNNMIMIIQMIKSIFNIFYYIKREFNINPYDYNKEISENFDINDELEKIDNYDEKEFNKIDKYILNIDTNLYNDCIENVKYLIYILKILKKIYSFFKNLKTINEEIIKRDEELNTKAHNEIKKLITEFEANDKIILSSSSLLSLLPSSSSSSSSLSSLSGEIYIEIRKKENYKNIIIKYILSIIDNEKELKNLKNNLNKNNINVLDIVLENDEGKDNYDYNYIYNLLENENLFRLAYIYNIIYYNDLIPQSNKINREEIIKIIIDTIIIIKEYSLLNYLKNQLNIKKIYILETILNRKININEYNLNIVLKIQDLKLLKKIYKIVKDIVSKYKGLFTENITDNINKKISSSTPIQLINKNLFIKIILDCLLIINNKNNKIYLKDLKNELNKKNINILDEYKNSDYDKLLENENIITIKKIYNIINGNILPSLDKINKAEIINILIDSIIIINENNLLNKFNELINNKDIYIFKEIFKNPLNINEDNLRILLREQELKILKIIYNIIKNKILRYEYIFIEKLIDRIKYKILNIKLLPIPEHIKNKIKIRNIIIKALLIINNNLKSKYLDDLKKILKNKKINIFDEYFKTKNNMDENELNILLNKEKNKTLNIIYNIIKEVLLINKSNIIDENLKNIHIFFNKLKNINIYDVDNIYFIINENEENVNIINIIKENFSNDILFLNNIRYLNKIDITDEIDNIFKHHSIIFENIKNKIHSYIYLNNMDNYILTLKKLYNIYDKLISNFNSKSYNNDIFDKDINEINIHFTYIYDMYITTYFYNIINEKFKEINLHYQIEFIDNLININNSRTFKQYIKIIEFEYKIIPIKKLYKYLMTIKNKDNYHILYNIIQNIKKELKNFNKKANNSPSILDLYLFNSLNEINELNEIRIKFKNYEDINKFLEKKLID